jgi:hypothetical protein
MERLFAGFYANPMFSQEVDLRGGIVYSAHCIVVRECSGMMVYVFVG